MNRIQRVLSRVLARAGLDVVTRRRIRRPTGLATLGNAGAAWTVPLGRIGEGSICYCAGVGEDVSFDLELIRRTGCTVHAFDPTPRAVAHVGRLPADERFVFHPWGLWDEDAKQRFYAPANEAHVSHSILNLQATSEFFEAECRALPSLVRELGHERLTLLKLDIEGAEYRVLGSLPALAAPPEILCVEFDECHHPLDDGWRERIRAAVGSLESIGYRLADSDGAGNYTFLR